MAQIPFDEQKARSQLLSFNYVSAYMEENGKRFNEIQQKILKIKDSEGNFTNLGYLVSDQNTKSIRVTVYDANDMADVHQKMEFTGSILKQYFDILDYLDKFNEERYTYVGQRRENVWDYPQDSLKQTLLNMLIHTDYEVKDANVIKVFTDRIEFSSFGGLPNGITFDDLFIGMSVCRNKATAYFFKNIDLASNFGLGIGIIRDCYAKSLAYPKIRVNEDIFKVILPNQHYGFDSSNEDDVHLSLAETSKMLDVLEALKQKGELSRKEIGELLKTSSTRTQIIIQHLLKKELLVCRENENGLTVYSRPR